MKKMFFAIILLILVITSVFLLFSSDIDILNRRFLRNFGIETDLMAVSSEEIEIPYFFDTVYQNYNLLQIEAGFDLLDYRGKKAVRYTYKMLNFPKNDSKNVYANVICINNKQVGGDICSTDIDGFMLPLNFLKSNNFN